MGEKYINDCPKSRLINYFKGADVGCRWRGSFYSFFSGVMISVFCLSNLRCLLACLHTLIKCFRFFQLVLTNQFYYNVGSFFLLCVISTVSFLTNEDCLFSLTWEGQRFTNSLFSLCDWIFRVCIVFSSDSVL